MSPRLKIPLGPIKTTSFSALEKYEKCPLSAKIKYVDRIKEPPSDNTALERGNRVHKDAEDFVQQVSDVQMKPLAKELRNFTAEMWKLREWYALGAVHIEEDWAFRRDWSQCGWSDKDVWLRVKLDILVRMEGDHLVVADHKTGKVYQIKHNDQGMLYAIAALLRFPDAKKITVEFWYHDQDELSCVSYTPEQVMARWPTIEKRLDLMTTATKFPARPSIDNCRYCPWKKEEHGGTGHCQHSVTQDPLAILAMRRNKAKGK